MAKEGRPTKYTPKMVDAVYAYLKEAIPENMEMPTIEGLALKIGVNKTTLYEWSKSNTEFSNALEELKLTQKKLLINTGIFGGKEINANIISLMLKVNHDMIETEKKLVEFKGSMIALDDNGDTKVHTDSTVPAETN